MDRLQVFEERYLLKRRLLNKLPYTFNRYFLVNEHNDVRVIKQLLVVPNLRCSTPLYIFMHFLPGISLLTLWRFVAEVRWLLPVSCQKKRESGKQRNTEPWRWELNENAAFSKNSATCSSFYRKYLSKSSVPVYCLFVCFCLFLFPFMAICWLFLFFVYKPASRYWNRVKRWTFQK